VSITVRRSLLAPTFGGLIGCGLATLEVAANSYIAVLGSPKYAAARLNFSQGFQGLASFAGPLIASKYFFRGANATSLDTVQWYEHVALDSPKAFTSAPGYISQWRDSESF
jgi:fucose permease